MISVLCVDDDSDFLSLSKDFLERNDDFRVDTSLSAKDAWALIRSCEYDVIISDYMMPGVDGLNFLRDLRKSGNQIPFILISCRGQELDIVGAINDGLSGYLSKEDEPVSNFAMLTHRIRQIVSLKRSEDSLKVSEERFKLLFTHMNEGVALFTFIRGNDGDPVDLKFEDVNIRYEEIFNLRREEILGKKMSEVVGYVPCLNILKEVISHGNCTTFERYFEEFSKYYSISVSRWLENGLAMIFSDITRQKELEEKNAASVMQLKKNLAELSILNDGIRNPLTVILGCLGETCTPQSENITLQVNTINHLISQLDIRWAESEKIIKFLEKHYNIHYNNVTDNF